MEENEVRFTSEAMREMFDRIENNLISLVNTELYGNLSLDNEKWEKVQLGINKKIDINNKIGAYLKVARKVMNNATSNISKKYDINVKNFDKEMNRSFKNLATTTMNFYKTQVKQVYSIASKVLPIREAIIKQAVEGFDKGLSVPTKSGRLYEYKSYMEMKLRTTISSEISQKQMDINLIAKNVFFVCSYFQDSEPLHAKYQGKVYYDDRYKSFGLPKEYIAECEKLIKSKRMLSVQQVRDNKPYLTTRPNCRHRFVPISLKQASGNISQTLQKLKLINGKYEEQKYKNSQDLRYCERNIRKYKDIANNLELLGKKNPNQTIDKQREKYLKIVKGWEQRANDVVKKSNNTLKRYEHREVRDFLFNDDELEKIEKLTKR